MYIKVYIFGMELSQRIHFWYQISLKMSIFDKTAKNHIFGKKKVCAGYKSQFWVKNAEIW